MNRYHCVLSVATILLALCATVETATAAEQGQAELDSLLAKVDKQLLADCEKDFRTWLDAGLTNRTGPFVSVRAGPVQKYGNHLSRSNDGSFKVNLQWSMAAGAAFPYFDGALVLGDAKYRQAALETADAFLRLQEPEGFWR
jgi:hypothetical protein